MKPLRNFYYLNNVGRLIIPIVIVLLLTFVPLRRAAAQTGRFFTTAQGLSGSVVKQIYQDHKGLIWIATNSGINVYNGYQMLTFQRDLNQEFSLSSNLINCLFEDKQGTMYVGTNTSLQVCEERQFYPVHMTGEQSLPSSFYVNCVYQRRNGEVLVGTSGNGLWRISGNREACRCGGAFARLRTVYSMTEENDGTLILVSNDQGVWALKGNRLSRYSNPSSSLTPQSVCIDKHGNVYVGCLKCGLWMKRKGATGFSLVSGTSTMTVTSLSALANGNVLIGTDGDGVKEYNVLTGMISTPLYYSNEVNLNSSKVSTILTDRNGNIWLGLM